MGGYGGVQLGVEPNLTEQLSLPIGLLGGLGGGFGTGVGIVARVGLRYKVMDTVVIGGGLGGGFYGVSGSTTGDIDVNYASLAGGLHLDIEAAFGRRWNNIGLSVATRPTFEALSHTLYIPVEIALAFYISKRRAITLHAFGGPFLWDMSALGGWGGGAIGLLYQF